MRTNRLIVCVVIFILLGCHNSDENKLNVRIDSTNKANKFDTTLIRVADYTGDGILDTAILHITGINFISPLSWGYDLWSKGQIVFHYEASDDSTSDRFYADSNYVGHCRDYINCKKKFFFQELGLNIDSSTYPADWIADFMKSEKWDAITYQYIVDSCGITDNKEAEFIVDSIASVIRTKKPKLISFLESAVMQGSAMIFVKRFNRFVPVYHE
ncbi:MAG: hypothetical protein ABSD46_09365 [Bacteroidota bacterium]